MIAVGEIKSISAKGFEWVAGGGTKGWKPKGPKPEHVDQVQLYLFMLGSPFGILIYENKNTQERAYFPFKRDMDRIRGVLLPKVLLVNEHVERGTLPPRDQEHQKQGPEQKLVFECQYCEHRQVCEEEEDRRAQGIAEISLLDLGLEFYGDHTEA